MSRFPDPVTQAIDDERRAFFGQDICYSTSTDLNERIEMQIRVTKKKTKGSTRLENLGAMVIPLSSGNTERQIMIMQDFRSTVPSFFFAPFSLLPLYTRCGFSP